MIFPQNDCPAFEAQYQMEVFKIVVVVLPNFSPPPMGPNTNCSSFSNIFSLK